MDLSRFHALYAAEAQEQLDRLVRALLALEAGDVASGVAEAFRAMHTLKSVAATMGHTEVASLAHTLEDTLEGLRAAAALDATTIDALLQRSDELQTAVALSLLDDESAEVAPEPAAGVAEPAAHVRVEQGRLDELSEVAGELAVLQARFAALPGPADEPAAALLDRMGRLIGELQVEILSLRMVPVSVAFDRCPRQVRDLAKQLGKEVELRMEGRDLRIDRAILEALAEPLLHLIRNAIDHGLETPDERRAAAKPARGTLLLRAQRDRGGVRIEVQDDGRGIEPRAVGAPARRRRTVVTEMAVDELLRHISQPGFTTAKQVTDVSGRGVGLDAVTTRIRSLGGALSMQTTPGEGTTFVLRVPVTRSLVQALRVRVGSEQYVIPVTHIAEAIDLDTGTQQGGDHASVTVRGDAVRLVRLAAVLGTGGRGGERAALLTEVGEKRAALAVDELVGREQILIKPFDAPEGTLPIFSGATLLGDGRPALVLDPVSVI